MFSYLLFQNKRKEGIVVQTLALGRVLRTGRERKSWDYRTAEKMVGLNHVKIWRIETGQSRPLKLDDLDQVVNAYELDMDEVMESWVTTIGTDAVKKAISDAIDKQRFDLAEKAIQTLRKVSQ